MNQVGMVNFCHVPHTLLCQDALPVETFPSSKDGSQKRFKTAGYLSPSFRAGRGVTTHTYGKSCEAIGRELGDLEGAMRAAGYKTSPQDVDEIAALWISASEKQRHLARQILEMEVTGEAPRGLP